ncbi:MAG: hypothetical protein M1840_003792 [Geoglossum simile]|nr:MAG: hypothetical protein M1840_003792 [Geoglossum simile]
MPYAEPHSQTSICHSTHISKPSARKCAHSESISQPSHSSQRAKKPSITTPRPVPPRPALPRPVSSQRVPPRRHRVATNDIGGLDTGDDAGDDTGENAGENAGGNTRGDAGRDAGGNEEFSEDEDIIPTDDELEEEEEEEEDTMKYLSVWKAIVNNKEVLCSRSRLFTVDFTMYSIQCWQREVLENATSRQLEVVRLEAIASYERCRFSDECPFELRDQRDIYDALEILRMWHNQHKRVSFRVMLYLKEAIVVPQSQSDSSVRTTGWRTATQRQIAELPDILQSETNAGNSMPQVADFWTCLNGQCRNKGKTCWINKSRPGIRDNAAEHYPVPGEIFRRWSREIADNLSTVEQPSQQIIVLLVNWRERERKKNAQTQQIPRPAEDITSTTNQLLQTLIAAQTQQLTQNLCGNRSSLPATLPPYPPPYSPPVPSSPVRSNSDPSEVLSQFFDWLIVKSSVQQIELLEGIKNKLLDEDWNLDTLRDERKGGAMTIRIWESYGFKLGTLANIWSRISEFKQQRRPQSRDSVETNSS